MQNASIINDVGTPRHKQKTLRETNMIPPKLLRTIAFSVITFLFAVGMGISTSFAQNTIYVDATNGTNIQPGTSAQPVASIEKGLELLENGGTLVLKGSTYNGTDGAGKVAYTIQSTSNSANNLASFTLRLEPGIASVIDLQTTALTINLTGTMTVVSSGGAYLNQQNTTLTLTAGNVNIDASTSWRLANNTTLTMTNTAAFTGAAPQKGTNLNLTYNGATVKAKTAGPEASYGTYGNGSISVNLTNADAHLTMPASITTTGNFTKTDGAVTLNGNLASANFTNTADSFEATGSVTTTGANTHTAGNVTFGSLKVDNHYPVTAGDLTVNGSVTLDKNGADLINNGTGDIKVTGNVDGFVLDGATDAHISRIENTSTGTITVDGTFTQTNNVALTAARDFTGAGFPSINASGSGDVTIGAFTITSSVTPTANQSIGVVLFNNGTETLTVGDVTATKVSDSGNDYTFDVTVSNNSTGTTTVGNGLFKDLANATTGSLTVGTATVSGSVQNDAGGTFTIAGGTVAGNFSNNNAASTANINGDVTVSGTLTNAGTGAGNGIDLGSNTLTLDGAVAHATNTGKISGAGKVLVTDNASFDGGTFSDVEVNGSGKTVTFQTNAITVSGLTVANGTLDVDIATTATSVTVNNSSATVNVDNVTLTTDSYTQSAGTFNLLDGTNDGAQGVLDVNTSFERTSGTFSAATGNQGTLLSFTGTAAQSVNVGDNFQVNDVTFNNTAGTITLNRSIRANGDANIAASTTVDFQGFNLIMNGANSDLTLSGSYVNTTNGGVYFGGVDAGGDIVVQGGSAAAGQTFSGTGTFGNIFVAVGTVNTLDFNGAASNAGFTNNLTLVSGTLDINGAVATDLSPSGTEAQVVVYPEGSNGITTTSGTFNGDNVNYNLVYKGSLSAPKTIKNEFTAKVVDVTVSTTTKPMVFADQDYTINGNLTVSSGATLEAAAAIAARKVTIKGKLTVAGDVTDGAPGAATTFVLETDGISHSVTGTFTDANSKLVLELQGDNVSVAGSGTTTAGKNIIDAIVNVTGANASISGIQELKQNVVIGAATDANLTLSLIDPVVGAPVTAGLIGGNIVVDNSAGGKAALKLDSDVEVSGTTTVGAKGTIDFTSKDLEIKGAFTGNAASKYTSTGGHLDVAAATTVDANGADIPYVRTTATTTLLSALKISGHLDLNADMIGAQALELSGNADLDANITNNVTFTGSSSTINVNNATRTITGTATVNSAGTVTFGNDGTARMLTVTRDYTHTKGAVNLANNDLQLNSNLIYTLGSIDMSTGYVRLNGSTVNTNENTLSLANVRVIASSVIAGAPGEKDELTITSNIILEDGDDFDIDNSGAASKVRLNIADGATITRLGSGRFGYAGAPFNDVAPNFVGSVDLVYDLTASQTTAAELPTTAIVNDVTVDLSNVDNQTLTLDKDLSFNGTLSMIGFDNDGNEKLVLAGKKVNVGEAASIEMRGAYFDTKVTPAGAYNLRYYVTATTGLELQGNAVSVTVDDGTNSAITVTASAAYNLASLAIGKNDVWNLGTFAVSIPGNFDASSGGSFAGTGSLKFNGTTEQTFTSPSGGFTMPANVDIELDNAAGMKLVGGNLTMGTGTSNFKFTDGLFRTDNNVLTLRHSSTSDQGFTRPVSASAGHVVGNVAKVLPSGTVPSNRVEFPVGAEKEDGDRAYSPLSFTFNDPTKVPAGVTMTVNHETFDPANVLAELGTKGFPIANGVEQGVDLARYPDRFRWTVKTSTSLSPTLVYNMEVERENYSAYTLTGEQADVEDLRIIRRAAGNIDNPWRLQGDASKYLQSYQTGDYPNVHPTVVIQDVIGGIQGGNGTVFTYALKSNMEGTQPADLVANAGQERKVALANLFTGGTGEYTYTISGNDVNVATHTVANDTLHITAAGVGSTSFNIKATDVLNDSRTVVQKIAVNAKLMVSKALPDTTVNEASVVKLTLGDYFTPGTGALSYTVSSNNTASATVSETGGLLEITAVAQGTATILVQATDSTNASVSDSLVITVNGSFAVDAGNAVADQTLRAGDNINQTPETFAGVTDVSTLFVGGTAPYTYSATSSANTIASATLKGDTLVVTATGSHINPASAKAVITVTAKDNFGTEVSANFNVTTTPAYGDVNADGKVNSADASLILKEVIEALETPFNATQIAVADVNLDSKVNSFDASVTFRYALETIANLPYNPNAKIASGEMEYGKLSVKDGIATVPVKVSGIGIVSFDFIGEFDATSAKVEDLTLSGLPTDWVIAKSITEEGKVKFAAAGVTPISNANVATIVFKMNNENSDVALKAYGHVNTTAFSAIELSTKELPDAFGLDQNYPNPFNPTTNIRYQLPAAANVTIELYSINGQKVLTLVSKRQDAGTYTVAVDGSSLASGIYFYRIQARSGDANFTSTRKMTLIK